MVQEVIRLALLHNMFGEEARREGVSTVYIVGPRDPLNRLVYKEPFRTFNLLSSPCAK